jgi:hypothetical protein
MASFRIEMNEDGIGRGLFEALSHQVRTVAGGKGFVIARLKVIFQNWIPTNIKQCIVVP